MLQRRLNEEISKRLTVSDEGSISASSNNEGVCEQYYEMNLSFHGTRHCCTPKDFRK
jgi:hypothetical protein